MALLDTVNTRLLPALSLESADDSWVSTLHSSAAFKFWDGLRTRAAAGLASMAATGTLLQIISFVLVALTLLIVAAPQFANDKEGLALIVCGAFGLRIIGTLLNGAEKYRPSAIDGLVLLFFALNVVASFASHYLRDSLFGLAKLFVYVIAYFLFTACLQTATRKRATILMTALTLGGTLVSLYGLWQFKHHVAPLATWEDPTVEDKATRVFSTLGNPNLLAGYLIPLLPVSFCLAMIAAFSKGIKRWLSIPVLGMCGIITAATFLTGSRGAYIAMIVVGATIAGVSIVWLWREYPKSRIPIVIVVLLAPVAAVLLIHFKFPRFEERFMSIFAGSEHSSNAYRMNVWRSSLRMFEDNWWIGIGTGNKTFRLAYGLYMVSGFDALGTYCVPLEVAVETGIFGLLAFAWLLLSVLARAHRRFWGTSDATTRWLAVAGAAAIIGMMAHGMVDTVFYRPQVQFIFWLMISLLVALPDDADKATS